MGAIIFGILLILAGIAMLKWHRGLYNFTGNLDFVERWITAGTPAFLKLVALLFIIVGMGMIFGIWSWLTDPIVEGAGQIFGGNPQR